MKYTRSVTNKAQSRLSAELRTVEVLNSPSMNLPLVQLWQTWQRGLITARICSLREGNVSVVSVGGSLYEPSSGSVLANLAKGPYYRPHM